MDRKIRIGAVSYLNTKPLIYGIENGSLAADIELETDYPARVAARLIDGSIDMGLVPVAVIPVLPESHVVTDYCIGCEGPVASVAIFSEVPLEQVKRVILDYQSRTSVMLARLLLRDFWKKEVQFVDADREDFTRLINGDVAAVVIGDRALAQRNRSKYTYDLGEAWKAHTGLPFVFAAWISNKALPNQFIHRFNQANQEGLSHLAEVVALESDPPADLMDYYTNNISYTLTAEKRKGMTYFLSMISTLQPLVAG